MKQVDRYPGRPFGSVSAWTTTWLAQRALVDQHFGDDLTIHGGLDKLVHIGGCNSVQQQLVAIEFNPQLRDRHLRLDEQVRHARDGLHGRFHFIRFSTQCFQVVAVDLDANLSFDSREHVRDQVGDRLLHGGHDAGDVGHRFADLVELLFARARRLGVQFQNQFAHVHAFGVLV